MNCFDDITGTTLSPECLQAVVNAIAEGVVLIDTRGESGTATIRCLRLPVDRASR